MNGNESVESTIAKAASLAVKIIPLSMGCALLLALVDEFLIPYQAEAEKKEYLRIAADNVYNYAYMMAERTAGLLSLVDEGVPLYDDFNKSKNEVKDLCIKEIDNIRARGLNQKAALDFEYKEVISRAVENAFKDKCKALGISASSSVDPALEDPTETISTIYKTCCNKSISTI